MFQISKTSVPFRLGLRWPGLGAISRLGSGVRTSVSACLVCAGTLTSLVWLLFDGLTRQRWSPVSVLAHLTASAVSMLTVGGVVTVMLAALLTLVNSRWLRLPGGGRVVVFAALGAALAYPAGQAMFSGAWISQQPWAPYGPWLTSLFTGVGMAGVAWSVELALRAQAQRRWRYSRALAALLFVLGSVGVYVDLHVYVALYSRLHTALEVVSFLLILTAVALTMRELDQRSETAQRWMRRVALVTVPVCALPLLLSSIVPKLEDSLHHVWREPVYAGRQLRRVKMARAFISAPLSWRGEQAAMLDELAAKYDVDPAAEDPRWSKPTVRPAQTVECRDCNLLVFYVDTLRLDVAKNPKLMPNFVRFASNSLSFERAYSTGSDTLNALPGLTGGRFPLRHGSHEGDLLRATQRIGMHRVLAIPKSAHEFLTKLHPDFAFDQVLSVPDYAEGGDKEVWGYGADQPTAARLVDETLAWIGEHRDQRFLSWVFNFEVHNWRELDTAYAEQAAERGGVSMGGDTERWRYMALAHEADRQLGRLLAGLKQLGLDKKTIVMVVSDHGESLGEWDSWLHSVLVWENLVHVPLMLRIPGVAPQRVTRSVSLADVAPTLVPLLGADAPDYVYHGRDLLLTAAQERGEFGEYPKERDFPILFVAWRKEQLVRVGLLEDATSLKLVLPLESGRPELYDTQSANPDEHDLASERPFDVVRLLDPLVRSPIFPRNNVP